MLLKQMCIAITLLLVCGLTASTYGQCVEGEARLQGLDVVGLPPAGRVEVCLGNEWGTICGDSTTQYWGLKNAQVVCRNLGYSGALNSISRDTLPASARASSSVPIHYSDVECSGDEDELADCTTLSPARSTCSHDFDVAIVCRDTTENSAIEGDVRLIGDVDDESGAVEVFASGSWLPVCYDNTWTDTEATIVCRQLGYEFGTAIITSVDPPIFTQLTDFNCDSFDERLTTCSRPLSICSTSSQAGVQCISGEEGSIRLSGGSRDTEGRVEVLYNGRWGTICDDFFWDNFDGEVACRELDHGDDFVDTDNIFDTFTGDTDLRPTWLGRIECTPEIDDSLSDCSHGVAIGFPTSCIAFSDHATVDCGDDSSTATDTGLSGGAVAGIVFAIVFVIFFIIPFGWAYGKGYWQKRNQYACWRALTCPYRWCTSRNWSMDSIRVHRTSAAEVTTTTATAEVIQRRSSSSSDRSVPPPTHQEEVPLEVLNAQEEENRELTIAPPPSYHAASRFPTADQPGPPPIPDELPPPYPGPSAAYPPAKATEAGVAPYPPAYPPPPPAGFQGYPPPTNLPYPSDFAYPPPGQGDEPSYPSAPPR